MISLSFPDSTYTSSNKPSIETLKGDLQLIEDGVNAGITASSTDTLTNKTLTSPAINTPTITSPVINGTITGTAIVGMLSLLNPIGTIREFNVATNPGTLLGFGTWTAYGTGRVTVSIDAGQTEFDTVNETGGEKTHTLLTTEMPSHNHRLSINGTSTGNTGNPGPGANTIISFNNSASIENTGGGGAHNNLQPYVVVYRWVRTA